MGKKPKAKKKAGRKIWILALVLILGFCAWVYWGNLPARPRPAPSPPRTSGGGDPGKPPAEPVRKAPVRPDPAGEEERLLLEKIQRNEAAGEREAAVRARFELSERYLEKALWEWTEFGKSEPDRELIRKSLEILDEVIRARPGTEAAAEAQLRRARVYRNGLSGLWDRAHREEAREELHRVLQNYPGSAAAGQAREILADLGK